MIIGIFFLASITAFALNYFLDKSNKPPTTKILTKQKLTESLDSEIREKVRITLSTSSNNPNETNNNNSDTYNSVVNVYSVP